jgi:uncharacterized membrane protein
MQGTFLTHWVLTFLQALLFVIWLGGVIVIDFVEAPARFRVAEITRTQAVAVGRKVFAALNRVEMFVGTALVAISAWLWFAQRTSRMLDEFCTQLALGAVALMLLIAAAQFFHIRPRLTELSTRLNTAPEHSALQQETRRVHRLYVALDVIKIALGLMSLGFWAAIRREYVWGY